MRNKLKIAFISGPADAEKIYREWSERKQQEYFGTDYMKQFLQVTNDLRAESYVVTWYGASSGVMRLGDFVFDNRPITTAGGLRYYLESTLWHLRLAPQLLRFRPDVLLLTGNQNFWWLLFYMRWFGAKIIISYHSVLWPKFIPVKRAWRVLLDLNRRLVLNHAKAIVLTSDDIRRQVEELLEERLMRVEILRHFPTYSPKQFAPIKPPDLPPRFPFRVFFMGRIEENKGVYDIVEIARQLESDRKGAFLFDICGSGGELEALRRRVRDLGLEQVVSCHGFSSPERVQELLGLSHAYIVPTRTDYEAGFEMTCAEAILAGRPLITSAVCPALEYLRAASVEVAPDNADEYRDAIVRLSGDVELYERKQKACAELQAQFYDSNNSWYAVMMRAMERHVLGQHSHAGALRNMTPQKRQTGADSR